jgi:hypothetical protein
MQRGNLSLLVENKFGPVNCFGQCDISKVTPTKLLRLFIDMTNNLREERLVLAPGFSPLQQQDMVEQASHSGGQEAERENAYSPGLTPSSPFTPHRYPAYA